MNPLRSTRRSEQIYKYEKRAGTVSVGHNPFQYTGAYTDTTGVT